MKLRTMVIGVILYFWMAFAGPVTMMYLRTGAFDLFTTKFLYNAIQIAINSYLLMQALMLVQRFGLSFGSCISSVDQAELAKLCWIWYMKKFLDLCDTAFLVLEQKRRSTAFWVQVFHHSKSLVFTWVRLHTSFDAGIPVLCILISMEHLIIFLYLFASMHSRDPKTGQSVAIWWKKQLILAKVSLLLLLVAHTTTLVGCPRHRLHMATILAVLPNVHFLLLDLVSSGGTVINCRKKVV